MFRFTHLFLFFFIMFFCQLPIYVKICFFSFFSINKLTNYLFSDLPCGQKPAKKHKCGDGIQRFLHQFISWLAPVLRSHFIDRSQIWCNNRHNVAFYLPVTVNMNAQLWVRNRQRYSSSKFRNRKCRLWPRQTGSSTGRLNLNWFRSFGEITLPVDAGSGPRAVRTFY